MGEVGLLGPDSQTELLNGQVIDFLPPTPLHAAITRRLVDKGFELPRKSCLVSVGNPVHIDDYNELQPDVMLLKFIPNYYTVKQPGPHDVFLLIEVADASFRYDSEEKLPIYARAGIPEYWIVNLQESTVEVYREPHFTGYEKKTVLQAGGKAVPSAFPDLEVDVAELLRR